MALGSFRNLSIAIYENSYRFIRIDRNKNRIIGLYGELIDRLIYRKNQRFAILKSVGYFRDDNIDESLQNESFVHMVKNSLVDVYTFPQNFNYENKYLEKSRIILIEPFQIAQILNESCKMKQINDLSSFFINNNNILLFILFGYLISVGLAFILCKLIRSIGQIFNPIKIKLINLLFLNYGPSFRIELIFLSFNIFNFFILSILRNSISTEHLIIKTDDFLNSNEKLLNTFKQFVFSYSQEEIYSKSPSNSFLFELYDKKVNKEDNYYRFITSSKNVSKFRNLTQNLQSSFFLMKKTSNLFALGFLVRIIKKNQFIYLNDRNFYEELDCLFIRKSLDKKLKEMIHWSINQYFENGIYLDYQSKFYDRNIDGLKIKSKIYFNTNQFITEQTSISDTVLENFRNIFIYFTIILTVTFLIFILHLIISRLIFIVYFFYFLFKLFFLFIFDLA